jgi:homoserine O-succinyltransferase
VIPVSRWTEVRQSEVDATPGLRTLLASDELGPCLLEDSDHRALYIFNHFEYDSGTLKEEYDRDVAAGKPINVPQNYYPGDDPSLPPSNRWRSHAHLLYGNWINEIYQSTPYDLERIGL